MLLLRKALALAAIGAALVAGPASAQFYFKSPDLAGAPMSRMEPGLGEVLPGATPEEETAALVWNMRAALNVAALQCQFEPTLLTLPTYNAILKDHEAELKTSFNTLTKYFTRIAKSAKAGQTALDQYGTRVYSSYSTVNAQLTFCQTAGAVSQAAIFAPRGSFRTVAEERMREIKNSLRPSGEQRFSRQVAPTLPRLPSLERRCWSGSNYNARRCGEL